MTPPPPSWESTDWVKLFQVERHLFSFPDYFHSEKLIIPESYLCNTS